MKQSQQTLALREHEIEPTSFRKLKDNRNFAWYSQKFEIPVRIMEMLYFLESNATKKENVLIMMVKALPLNMTATQNNLMEADIGKFRINSMVEDYELILEQLEGANHTFDDLGTLDLIKKLQSGYRMDEAFTVLQEIREVTKNVRALEKKTMQVLITQNVLSFLEAMVEWTPLHHNAQHAYEKYLKSLTDSLMRVHTKAEKEFILDLFARYVDGKECKLPNRFGKLNK